MVSLADRRFQKSDRSETTEPTRTIVGGSRPETCGFSLCPVMSSQDCCQFFTNSVARSMNVHVEFEANVVSSS